MKERSVPLTKQAKHAILNAFKAPLRNNMIKLRETAVEVTRRCAEQWAHEQLVIVSETAVQHETLLNQMIDSYAHSMAQFPIVESTAFIRELKEKGTFGIRRVEINLRELIPADANYDDMSYRERQRYRDWTVGERWGEPLASVKIIGSRDQMVDLMVVPVRELPEEVETALMNFRNASFQLDEVSDEAERLVNEVTTTKQLLKLWPQARDFFPEEVRTKMYAEPKPRGSRTVREMPDVNTDALAAAATSAKILKDV